MKKSLLVMMGGWLALNVLVTPVFAQTSPSINLTVDSAKVNPGEEIVFNVTYRNNDEEVLENGRVSLDLALQSGLTLKSSSPPIDLSGSQPFWRLPAEVESGGEGVLSLTLLVGSNYDGSSISTSGSIDGKIDNSAVSAVSNSVGVQVVTDESEDDEEEGDEDNDGDEESADEENDESNNEEDDEDDEDDDIVVEDLLVDSIEQEDVANIVGVLDLPEGNINAWDSRYLIIGAAAFVLILSAGIIAFFLGRKSK